MQCNCKIKVSDMTTLVFFSRFSLVFVQWSMFQQIRLSLCDVIVFEKSSTGDGIFTFCGWGYYFHRSLSGDLHYCDTPMDENEQKRKEKHLMETTTSHKGVFK